MSLGDQDAKIYGETIQRDLQHGGIARAQSPGGTSKLIEPEGVEQQEPGEGHQGFVPQGY
eukprot:1147754-Pelagomonas_calceolata.AAC.1